MCLAKHQNKVTNSSKVSNLNWNASCFRYIQVRHDKCFSVCTTCLVWFSANKSKVFKELVQVLKQHQFLKLLSSVWSGALLEGAQNHSRRKIILADDIFNTISRRAEPNFFHMVASHEPREQEAGFAWQEEKHKNGHISNMFYCMSGTLSQYRSAVKLDTKRTFTSFPSYALFEPP